MRSRGASSTSGGAGHVGLGEHWSGLVLWLCESVGGDPGWRGCFFAATPDATAFIAATVGWPSFLVLRRFSWVGRMISMPRCLLRSPCVAALFFAVESPVVLAALSGGLACCAALSGFLRRLRGVAAFFFWDGCRGVAQSGLGPVIVASWGCFQSFPGRFAALLAAFEMVAGAVAVSSSSSSQYEWVEQESDHEPELMHFVFEHEVSEGLCMVECQRDRARPVDRVDENVFDFPAVVRRMGWDDHELMHMVFEFGKEEGMRTMEVFTVDDASSVVFQGGVVQEPRVCLALDELIPANEVRQACEAPEPAKSVQILFRGQQGLGVGNWRLSSLLRSGILGRSWSGVGWVLLPRLEGRSLTRG